MWLLGSNSETKVFRDLGPKPPIPLAFGSPSHATAAQCAEEGGSARQAGRMTGRSFSNGRLHKARAPQTQPAHISTLHIQANRPKVGAQTIPSTEHTICASERI